MNAISSMQREVETHVRQSYGSIEANGGDDDQDGGQDVDCQQNGSINASTTCSKTGERVERPKVMALSVVLVALCLVVYSTTIHVRAVTPIHGSSSNNNNNNNDGVLRHNARDSTGKSASSSPTMALVRPSTTQQADLKKKPFTIPFPQVDRADYGDPVSSFLQEDLFADRLRSTSTESPNRFIFPFPTGAFWTNFALPSTADKGISYPIAVYPYAYKWSPAGFLQASYAASHRQEDATSIRDNFYPDVSIASVETDVSQRKIQSFDPLSVTLRFSAAAANNSSDDEASSSSHYFESYLVQGSPYITMKYQILTPSIKALSQFLDLEPISNSDDSGGTSERRLSSTANGIKSVTGTHFLAKTREGLDWMIASSEPITLDFNTRIPTTLTASKPFSGVLRLACLPGKHGENKSEQHSKSSTTGLQRLVEHSSVYPIGGAVDWTFRTTKENRVATLHFDFDTKTFDDANDDSSKELLMLALPHHAKLLPKDVLLSSKKEFDLTYECIKGQMTAVTGSSWKYDEPLLNIGFAEGPGSVKPDDKVLNDSRVRESLINNLQHDVNIALPVLNENIYGYGKQAARLAQLVFIGNELLRTGKETDSAVIDLVKLVDKTVQALYKAMASLLDSETNDKLIYDANLGGIVTSDGLANTQADFGNGMYNDHHFHYS